MAWSVRIQDPLGRNACDVVAVGIWKMRKWGVVLVAGVAVLIHILYAFTGLLNLETFVIYLATLGPAAYFYPRMK